MESEKITLDDLIFHFSNATGINLFILDENFKLFKNETHSHKAFCELMQSTPEGVAMCRKSDRYILERCRETGELEVHTCPAGLIDMAVPICYEHKIIGYIILGQMKTNLDFEGIRENLSALSPNIDELKMHYDNLVTYDETKIDSISQIATMLAKYIILNNLLKPTTNDNLNIVIDYIENNLDKRRSIADIVQDTHISKSTLYKLFRDNFGCTLSEFINNKKIEKSKHYLLSNEYSIEEISQKFGFSSAACYSKNFKSIVGLSPIKFKNKYKNRE